MLERHGDTADTGSLKLHLDLKINTDINVTTLRVVLFDHRNQTIVTFYTHLLYHKNLHI